MRGPRVRAALLVGVGLTMAGSRAAAAPGAEQQYARQKKSSALAVTLEALCPLAGAGALYAGDTEHAAVLAAISGVSGGAAVGAAFTLLHLYDEHPTGADHVVADIEKVSAWSALAVAVVAYTVTRISGLAYAPDATAAFNDRLRETLPVAPETTTVRFHATVLSASLRF